MQFEKITTGPAAEKPLAFPDHPIIPTKVAVFDDTELHYACKQCRFFREYVNTYCDNPKFKVWDPVHGWCTQRARELRSEKGACGPEGKGWEARAILPTWRWFDFVFWALMAAGGLLVIYGLAPK